MPNAPIIGVLVAALALLGLILWMRPRRYYFVRHGETLLNKAKVKQGAEGALSELGEAQAAQVGAVMKKIGVRLICASPYERAKQTASIIAAQLRRHVSIRYSPLLVERKNPSDVIGKQTHDPEVERIVGMIDLSYHEDGYRYSDEENFLDLRKRARKCLRYLERQHKAPVCVVTHHAFLKMLLSTMLYGTRFSANDFIKLSYFNPSENGGITACEYHPWSGRWKVLTYNESA